jgi:hypothetical protein
VTVDQRLLKQIRAWVDDSLAYKHANPIEMADYIYDLYNQHGRMDRLALMMQRWRLRMWGIDND